jgi:Family of unknown function (DUF6364)
MNTKLTLRLDAGLIRRAKAYARNTGKSVSAVVADYFASLEPAGEPRLELTPRVRSLRGALKGTRVAEESYRKYLEGKHR